MISRKKMLWFFAALITTFFACTESPTVAGGSSDTELSGAVIVGKAVDSRGTPYVDADVKLRKHFYLSQSGYRNESQSVRNTLTDSLGSFSFDSVDHGYHVIEISNDGDSSSIFRDIEVKPTDSFVELKTDTLRPNAFVSGSIELMSRVPVRGVGAIVEVFGLERSVKTDPYGRFILALPEGTYRLNISADTTGFHELELLLDVIAGEYKNIGHFRLHQKNLSPCSDYECDAFVIRSILDKAGYESIEIDSIAEVRHERIVEVSLRGLDLGGGIEDLSRLSYLEVVDLGNNNLSHESLVFINHLWRLTELKLDSNRLQELPFTIDQLTGLQLLDISNNELSTLPWFITNIKPETFLGLSGNNLCFLPFHIENWADTYDPGWRNTQYCSYMF
ncbi:hypothetical protein QA601_02205 [Chitinispirillales bacterium ANBcel5]|uniref:hypothetical protein n=1 Tax=Cellulosispirillum alkaliphilum TaxID=3039283 RepID=UPI002A50E6C3|nr:hypothetical protein [Chitinispirillales bacterium ANBcel5]